jgi:hypothetical protein
MSNDRFAYMREQDYELRFILIRKINVKDILEIKYLMLTLMQIKLYLQNRGVEPSQVLIINVNV